jgi:BlaI family transcriptional regulator, penicillinase repressor
MKHLNPAKMSKKNKTEEIIPTKAELEALKILWEHGPSTVRYVHDILNREVKDVRYTSTLKMMQVMTEKGMVKRDETNMTHVYYPLLDEQKTMGIILDRFVRSMYNGSISNLLVAFVNSNKSSGKELQKLKELLKKLEKDQPNDHR